MDVSGLILAGGRATRMGGEDKGLVPLDGTAMITHVIARLAPQVDQVAINANRHTTEYQALGYSVVADESPDFAGPLAGMLAGLAWCSSAYLQIVPCDGPLLASDLVMRLRTAIADADVAVAHDGERLQPAHLLIAAHRYAHLRAYIADGGRKIDHWLAQLRYQTVDFSDRRAMFINVNTLSERDAMAAMIQNPELEAAHDANP